MNFTKTIAAAATAALMSTSAMAADIAVIAGSIEDGFFSHQEREDGGQLEFVLKR